MRKAIGLLMAAVVLLACVMTGCRKADAEFVHEPDFVQASTSVFLLELNSGDIIYEKASDDRERPFALTQMLTALLAIEETEDLTAEVVSPVTLNDGTEKETSYTMGELLRYVILDSNADAAQLIASTVGGGDAVSFISRLNERARGLSAESTNFVDASGEGGSNNYTTARDMALIASAVCQNEVYMSIAHEPNATVPETDTHDEAVIENENGIENSANESTFCAGARGIKYSEDGQGSSNLVCIMETNGMRLLLVAMGAPTNGGGTVYTDAKGLYDWASSTCTLAQAPQPGKPVIQIPVSDELAQDSLSLLPAKKLDSLLPSPLTSDDVLMLCRTPAVIDAPVRKGKIVGAADILHDNELVLSVDLVAAESASVKGQAPGWVGVLLTVCAVILALLVLLLIVRQVNIIRYRRMRLRKLDEKRR
ncbi:MAG: D-alanyl-D-alanine carboxypeptidase family protein, partial [Acetanaerobacterium sp.]